MATSFSRTGSTSNRRSANINGTKSRASTSRAGDYLEPVVHDGDLSAGEDEKPKIEEHSKRHSKRGSKDVFVSERRVEKRNVVTREKVIRRSPVKVSGGAGEMEDRGRQTTFTESPISPKKGKQEEEREQEVF